MLKKSGSEHRLLNWRLLCPHSSLANSSRCAPRPPPLQFVKQFAAKGNRVIAACRSPDAVKKQLEGLGDVAVTQLDVSSPASIEDFADAVQQLTPHVDVVVNNAGTNGGSWGITLETLTAEHLMNVFNVNAIGPLLVVQQLRRRGLLGGKAPTTVANITSKMGSIDDNTSGGSYA